MSKDAWVPNSWQWTTLGEVTQVVGGGTPRSGEPDHWHGDIPWITPADLSGYHEKTIAHGGRSITDTGLARSAARLLPTGTVLFSSRAPIGYVAIAANPIATNQGFKSFIPPREISSSFLYYYLQSAKSIAIQSASGTTFKELSKKRAALLPFPLAPLPEQQRIVAKIESLFARLDEGIAALKRAEANLARYRASVLKAAVEGRLTEQWRRENLAEETGEELLRRTQAPPRPSRYRTRSKDVIPGHAALSVGATHSGLPHAWSWAPLADVARLESGHTPSRRRLEWWGGDVPWVGLKDARAHHGGTIFETLQTTNEDGLANSAARLLPRNTVCLSRTASVGYVIVLGRPMATSQDFVNWICTEAVVPSWLQIVLLADPAALRRFGKGSTHTTVYFPEVLSLHVAVPPLAEQRAIVAEVDARLSQAADQEAIIRDTLQRSSILRQSILKRAFEGRLVLQDPADEPASALLERIQAEREVERMRKKRRPSHRKRHPRSRVP